MAADHCDETADAAVGSDFSATAAAVVAVAVVAEAMSLVVVVAAAAHSAYLMMMFSVAQVDFDSTPFLFVDHQAFVLRFLVSACQFVV
jgi:hypothetical protein